jgi:hypothetical protein
MTKRTLLLSIALFVTVAMSAKVYIPLVKSVPPGTAGGGSARVGERTSSYAPLAYYEEDTIHIQFPYQTATSVIITNDSTDLVVLSESCPDETTILMVPINELTLYKSYNLSINAYGTWWVGYFEYIPSTPKQAVQKYFSVVVDNPNSERNYGVYSVAGNATPGLNFGVSGVLSGSNGGTGIYGSSQYDEGFNTSGRYAGLFHGDLKTTDAVYASAYNTLADSRLNKETEQLNECLDDLMQVNVFRYSLKQFEVNGVEESRTVGYYSDDSGILKKEHYGLSGQEIMEIYPNLVSINQDGYLSINYVEMIPLLIQSIQELKAELDKTNAQLDALKSSTNVPGRVADNTAVLYQNTPNPFSERSVVRCSIPQDVNNALFCIYDYNGRQIQSRSISERGDVRIVVDGNSLVAGIYLYSLIIDGNLVDTKRMVKTE